MFHRPALALALSMLSVLPSFAKGPIQTLTVGNWQGGSYTDDVSGAFSHCAASVRYVDGTGLVVAIGRGYGWSIGIINSAWRLQPGQSFPVEISFDTVGPFRLTGKVLFRSFVEVEMPTNDVAIDAFRAAIAMHVLVFGDIVHYNLTSTSELFPTLKDCVAANLQTVVASTARPQAADELVLECGPSTVLVGETGRNGVVATTVFHDPVRSSWSVIHHLADSTVVARETQYSMADASQGVGAATWAGYLNRNHDLQMIGRLTTDQQSDGLVYEEFLYDRGHSDQLILHSQTYCKRATTSVVQSAPPEPPSVAEAPSAPPTPQPSAPPTMPRGGSVPIYFERDGRAVFVDVILGSQPAHMLIDTGATSVTVSESLAQELLSRGEAAEGPSAQVQLADGSTTTVRNIYVHTLKIGDNVLRDIRAGVTPDGTDMLLGFPVLNQIGRFTIDTVNRRLIFG